MGFSDSSCSNVAFDENQQEVVRWGTLQRILQLIDHESCKKHVRGSFATCSIQKTIGFDYETFVILFTNRSSLSRNLPWHRQVSNKLSSGSSMYKVDDIAIKIKLLQRD